MINLTFIPRHMGKEWSLVPIADAVQIAVDRRQAAGWEAVSKPSDLRFKEVRSSIDHAQMSIVKALSNADLRAYAHIIGEDRLYEVPSDYWRWSWADASLAGQLFAFPSESMVPAGLRGASLFVDGRDFSAWVGKGKPRTGPKPKYDREAFLSQAVNELRDEGGFGVFTRADLERRMSDWCEGRWPSVPGRTWIMEQFDEANQRYLSAIK